MSMGFCKCKLIRLMSGIWKEKQILINILFLNSCDRKILLFYAQFILRLNCQMRSLNLGRKENLLLKGLLHFLAMGIGCIYAAVNLLFFTSIIYIMACSRKSCTLQNQLKTTDECRSHSDMQWKTLKKLKNLVLCCSALTSTEKVN